MNLSLRLFTEQIPNLLPPHLRQGVAAEKSALAYLRANGLKLLKRNYRCAYGELDIVMRDQQVLVFVEVRYRADARFGGAANSINADKQRKLRRSGEAFLQHHPNLGSSGCRFDVLALSGTPPKYEIDWIRDAF